MKLMMVLRRKAWLRFFLFVTPCFPFILKPNLWDLSHVVSETQLAVKVVGSELGTGLKEGFQDASVANCIRGTLNGLIRFADSLLLPTISLGEVGYDSFDLAVSGAKFGLNRTSVWGMTIVKSFEDVVG
jgi:hypothetical protein